ncbi:MAG: pyridine nucleotide-disulfide oxidoreductase [Cyclobacteriaceae bacterium]|nr:MAG: pyridine nucleotide-disulfide oxidoreductase [Cyclobacteriaceae bacterium]
MEKYKVLIIGGGTAGITVAATLLRKQPKLKVAIIEPSDKHYYQPAWTLVGAGTYKFSDTERDEKDLIPKSVHWIRDYAEDIDPESNLVTLSHGEQIEFEALVVATGVQYNWNIIPGLEEGIGKHSITSNYDKKYATYTWESLKSFKGGNAVFTQPHTPIKCGGAPQKIMYLAEHYFRKNGKRENTNVIFATPGTVIFGVQPFKDALLKIVKDRNIHTFFFHKLVEIRPEQQEAVYEVTKPGHQPDVNDQINQKLGIRIESDGKVIIPFNFLHTAPPQSAPDFIKNSPLSKHDDPYGYVEVDKHTLQHSRYPNVFSLGDVAGTPNAKTGAAIRKQAPVVVANIIKFLEKGSLEDRYHGYSSCPIVTGYGKMLLAEFDYENKAAPSLPIDTSKPRWDMWILKKYLLPWFYWNRMLKGKG